MVYDGNQVVAGVRAGRVQEGLDVKAIHRECHCRAELGGKVGVVAEALQLDAKHLRNSEPEGRTDGGSARKRRLLHGTRSRHFSHQ